MCLSAFGVLRIILEHRIILVIEWSSLPDFTFLYKQTRFNDQK